MPKKINAKKNNPAKNNTKNTGEPLKVEVSHERKVHLSWTAPSRPFKKRNREYYTTIAAIVFLVSVILILVKEMMLIGTILSLGFVAYALSAIPPEDIQYAITNKGIELGDHHFVWDQMVEYWIEDKWQQKIVVVSLFAPYHTYLRFMLGSQKEEEVKEIMSEFIPFQTHPQKSWIDQASEWLSKKIPLESKSS